MRITNDQRGLLFKRGNYVRHLKPGAYSLPPFSGRAIVVLDVNRPFHVPEIGRASCRERV